MEFPRQITAIGAATIVISTIEGVGILALPRYAASAADTGAPLVTLLGMLLAVCGLWFIAKLGARFPDKSIFLYAEELVGVWVARLGSMLIISFFILKTALIVREFGEVIVTVVLPKTPLEVTVLIMLLLAAVSVRYDMATFSYIHLFYIPFVVFPGLVIFALSLKNASMLNLQPLLGNEPNGMWIGMLTIAGLFQTAFVLTIVIPSMRRPEKAIRSAVWGTLIGGMLYILIVIATVAAFGPEETKMLFWPTLELARMTSLPANILERLDAVFLIVWVTAVFTTLLSSFYLTAHALGNVLRLRDHKLFSFFLLPFLFLLAMMYQDIFQMNHAILFVGRFELLLTIAYPFLLYLTALVRKKGGKPHEKAGGTP